MAGNVRSRVRPRPVCDSAFAVRPAFVMVPFDLSQVAVARVHPASVGRRTANCPFFRWLRNRVVWTGRSLGFSRGTEERRHLATEGWAWWHSYCYVDNYFHEGPDISRTS